MILFWTPVPYGEAPNANITTSRGNTTAVSNTRSGHSTPRSRRTVASSQREWDQLPLQPAAPEGCAFEEDGVFLDEDSLISAIL